MRGAQAPPVNRKPRANKEANKEKENEMGSIKKKRRKKMSKHKYDKRMKAQRHKNK